MLPPLWTRLRSFLPAQLHRARLPRVRLGTIPLLFGLRLPYTLPPSALGTHIHLMGLSGAGKSKLLALFAAQLISQGHGCAVIDPHADLTQDILLVLLRQGYFRRPHAFEKLLYLEFGRTDRFVPFNILRSSSDPYQVARLLVEACTRAWPSLSGGAAPQFENLLLAATTVLIANQLPLTALTPLLTNAAYREQLLTRVADPLVTAFFRERYAPSHGTGLSESTLRRAFLLSYPPPLRFSLGQRENLLNFRGLMDRGISMLCNLGTVDAQTQRILGSLLTVGFETAALSRANQPPAFRRPYHLFVDEFAQFAAQSETALENVLALTRKYRLFLVLAHQTWSQLSTGLRGAVQNTTFLSFRLGAEDAQWAAERIGSITPYAVKYQTPCQRRCKNCQVRRPKVAVQLVDDGSGTAGERDALRAVRSARS